MLSSYQLPKAEGYNGNFITVGGPGHKIVFKVGGLTDDKLYGRAAASQIYPHHLTTFPSKQESG